MGNQALEARERLKDVKIGLSDTSNDCPRECEGFLFNALSYDISGGMTCRYKGL